MKYLLNFFILFFAFLIFEEKSYALTDYQIKEICKKKIRKSSCVKYLQEKRSNLLQGNRIEIPVIPFKR